MSDREDIIKEISARVRIYKPKTENIFPIEIAFPNDFSAKKGKEGKYYNKTETDVTLKLPVSNPIKAIYKEDHAISDQYLELFRTTSDIYSKIIYINRAIDYDLLSISKYQNAIQYYESLANASGDTLKEEQAFYTTFKSEIDEQISWIKLLIDNIRDYNERQCQVPILFDMEVKKRVETNNWALDNRRNFLEFVTKTFNPLVNENLDSRGKTTKYNESTGAVEKVNLFKHQQFISDFIQDKSPYRGVLLFYGLGSGKTLSSINIAEGMERKVYIFLPKSIKNNFKDDMTSKGNTLYHTQNHWCFYNFPNVDFDGDLSILENMGFPVQDKTLLKKLYINRPNGAAGFWVVDKTTLDNNFDVFSPDEQSEIEGICNTLRDYKYKFIHYNGGQSLFKTTLTQLWHDELFPKYDTIEETLIVTKLHKPANTKANTLTKKERNELKNHILEYIYDPANKISTPFDNTLIIIDEVHNFMSQICNGSNNGTILYEMFMRSKNCKIVALSGTPIINSPFESSILFNMLKGYTTYIHIPLKTKSGVVFDQNVLSSFLLNYPDIDRFEINLLEKNIGITRMPNGFRKNLPIDTNTVTKDLQYLNVSDDDFLSRFIRDISTIGYLLDNDPSVEHYSIFPDIFSVKNENKRFKTNIERARDEFYDLYIDRTSSKVRNQEEFLYRIMGLVSFYNEIVSDELKVGLKDTHSLFPELFYDETKPEYVDISMSQLFKYHDVRVIEREREKRDRKSSKAELIFNIESKVSKTFKVTSRQALLFTFPLSIVRPRLKVQYCDQSSIECKQLVKAQNKEAELQHEIALRQLFEDLDNKTYLTINDNPEGLQELSPKFAKMLQNIFLSPGLVFIYSQFRSVEGVEIFALVLKNNGFEKFNTSNPQKETHIFNEGDTVRVNPYDDKINTWITSQVIAVDGEMVTLSNVEFRVDRNRCFRARYAIWSGTETDDERKTILREYKSDKNKFGQIINILLTTASGSEGINLKYVRQVHIMEPYWNKVRVDQVIGRARRIESHKDLPEDQRNVTVYEYVSRFTDEQKSGAWETSDKYSLIGNKKQITAGIVSDGKTSDEELLDITIGKYKLIHQFLTLVKRGSVDCMFNRDDNIFSDPTFKTEICLDRVISQDSWAYDPKKPPVVRVEGVTERKIVKSLHIFPSRIFGDLIHLMYEKTSDIIEISNLTEDVAIPIYNFYTYYGINPMSSDMKKTKNLIGSFRRESDDGPIQIALTRQFEIQIPVFKKIETIIQSLGNMPDFSNETELVIWINKIHSNQEYIQLMHVEVTGDLQQMSAEAPSKRVVKINLQKK
jgi:hypothetical protein